MDAQQAVAEITSRLNRRPTPRNEVAHAVQKVFSESWRGGTSSPGIRVQPIDQTPKWPAVAKVKPYDEHAVGVADLWERSPVRFDDELPHSQEILETLFSTDDLICAGRSTYEFTTQQLWCFDDLSQWQFIVPSPMSAEVGTTQDGIQSAHCLDNTGPRRFAVIECDEGTADEQAALLLHLSRKLPLALVVLSGGKSVHGWYFVVGIPEPVIHKFFRYAVSLGADRATHTRSQFVRMPDGLRDNGKRQSVVYFNPETTR